MSNLNDTTKLAINSWIEDNDKYGTAGIEETNCEAIKFTKKQIKKMTPEQQRYIIAICCLINELHDEIDEIVK